jgi:hypothetical protein
MGIDRYKTAPVATPAPSAAPAEAPVEVAEQNGAPAVAANVEAQQ